MKKILILALVFGVLSSIGHFYLAKRSYELQVGEASASRICNIGENINCDQALLSPYAKIYGISLSNFGLGFSLILSFLLLFFIIFGASSYWKNISFYFAGVIAFSSIVMIAISLLNSLYCPICWSLYVFSFLILACLFVVFKQDLSQPIPFLLQSIKQKSSYIFVASLFLVSLFFHINFVSLYDLKNHEETLDAVFNDWMYEEAVEFNTNSLLQKGNKEARMKIVEFADFLCPACKKAQAPLKKFLKNFPQVQFSFYAYPLDGVCNPSISFHRSGLSCELSKAVICAETQNKGWWIHDFIFENQSRFLKVQGSKEKTEDLFNNMILKSKLDSKNFKSCLQDPKTLEAVKESAKMGNAVRIQGTPTFFINGKRVRHHSSGLFILKRTYEYLRK